MKAEVARARIRHVALLLVALLGTMVCLRMVPVVPRRSGCPATPGATSPSTQGSGPFAPSTAPSTHKVSDSVSDGHVPLDAALKPLLARLEDACAKEDDLEASEVLVALGHRLRDPREGEEVVRWLIDQIHTLTDSRCRLLLASALSLYKGIPSPVVLEMIRDRGISEWQVALVVTITTMALMPQDWMDAVQGDFWRQFLVGEQSIMPAVRERWREKYLSDTAGGAYDSASHFYDLPLFGAIHRGKTSQPGVIAAVFDRVEEGGAMGERLLADLDVVLDMSSPTTTELAIRLYANARTAPLRKELLVYIRHGSREVATAELVRTFATEPDEGNRAQTVKLICELGDQGAVSIARRVFEEGQPRAVKMAAIDGLAFNLSDSTLDEIRTIVETTPPALKAYALESLSRYNAHSSSEAMERIFLASCSDPDTAVRKAALMGLGIVGGSEYRARLQTAATSDPSEDIRRSVGDVLEMLDK